MGDVGGWSGSQAGGSISEIPEEKQWEKKHENYSQKLKKKKKKWKGKGGEGEDLKGNRPELRKARKPIDKRGTSASHHTLNTKARDVTRHGGGGRKSAWGEKANKLCEWQEKGLRR